MLRMNETNQSRSLQWIDTCFVKSKKLVRTTKYLGISSRPPNMLFSFGSFFGNKHIVLVGSTGSNSIPNFDIFLTKCLRGTPFPSVSVQEGQARMVGIPRRRFQNPLGQEKLRIVDLTVQVHGRSSMGVPWDHTSTVIHIC